MISHNLIPLHDAEHLHVSAQTLSGEFAVQLQLASLIFESTVYIRLILEMRGWASGRFRTHA